MFGYKSVVAALTVATMLGSSAFAADKSLAPGKPAGVSKAQFQGIGTGTLIIGLGAAAIIAAIAITVSDQSANNLPAGNLGTGNTSGVSTAGTTS